ncbi:MAG: hypothetical protein J5I47_06655 [Vicingus serpentipes]|nr:hypothetical protein [Vicingus serpentipes]
MEKYPIHITSEITEEQLQEGLFLFMFRATKIPPHIGVITNGLLFDITSVGPNRGTDVLEFYQTCLKRKNEVVFIALKQTGSSLDMFDNITEKVDKYWKVTEEVSCLNPIKDFIEEAFDIEVNHTNFIFELLPILYDHELIEGVSQLNLSKKLKDNVFELKKYTKEDIDNCIKALTRKESICIEE